ncbi:isoaspartyl peptidase/L-asparaginase-like [Apis laboriosa]|uniref:isoaspartyl peptidase/L-asparaginase-like n=1 Tax=Apis laboriosa TaxID=183418 RepID=UPI001CC46AEF|nr:isoaspartyl peptidase/L-asparaginase-like [Apis laboriosa]
MCDYCSWIDQILTRIRNEIKPEKKKRRVYVDPVIIVHGGAGKIPRNKRKHILFEVKNAAIEAYSDLINGRSAVDAVEKAISYMESRSLFNCGKGGSLDINNEVVMDAAIMTTKDAGCVGAVRDIEHPISLARKVLEKTEHILIVEKGAQKFALDHEIPILPPSSLREFSSLSSFKSISESFENEQEECEINELKNEKNEKNEENEKKKCDSNCVIYRYEEGEVYPRELSDDDVDIVDEPIILQVCFLYFCFSILIKKSSYLSNCIYRILMKK